MAAISELPQDQMLSGKHYNEQPQDGLSNAPADEQIDIPVLVVGGGPVGMLLAHTLGAYHCVSNLLVEQSSTTTNYPKMEYTNTRSMEIYRRLGLADQLRAIGVDPESNLNEIIATGLGKNDRLIATWERPSPAELERETTNRNDGTGPCEAYMRCHQIPIERWLKGLVETEKNCQSRWNCKFVGLEEGESSVVSELETADGRKIRVRSEYVVGCDGAGSLVRKAIGKESERTDMNLDFMFIHFKSRDPILRSMGQYWHCNLLSGGALVDQGNDIWTLHSTMPPGVDTDPSNVDPQQFISHTLGGNGEPLLVKIDEVFVKGRWGSRVAIADSYRSSKGRVFIAGDAAHQLSPVGGFGLNTGIGDAWDISWKLAAVLSGWGGAQLLESYDAERRPVAHIVLANVMKAVVEVVGPMFGLTRQHGDLISADTTEGKIVRKDMAAMIDKGHWVHNQQGKILGLRYSDSPVIVHELDGKEPPQNTTEYFPSTWPGARPPHVLLGSRKLPIFDTFGKGYTLIDFNTQSHLGDRFFKEAQILGIPLELKRIPNEPHARKLWERDVVLIRPDGHVAWRLPNASSDEDVKDIDVRKILIHVSGNGK